MRDRGTGCVFQKPGTKFWWLAYSFRGKPFQESSKSTDRKVAERLLRQRLKEVSKPNFVNPAKEERWTLVDMKEKIRLDYERKGNRSFEDVENSFKHFEAEDAFKFTGWSISLRRRSRITGTNDSRPGPPGRRSTMSSRVSGAASNSCSRPE